MRVVNDCNERFFCSKKLKVDLLCFEYVINRKKKNYLHQHNTLISLNCTLI